MTQQNNQQNNRPQQNNQQQQPRPPIETNDKELQELRNKLKLAEAKVLELENMHVRVATVEVPRVVVSISSDILAGNSTEYVTLRMLIAALLYDVIEENLTPTQAQHVMHKWHEHLPLKLKQEFIANRQDAENTMNYFKQVLDTFSQELPMLFVR